MYMYSNHQHQKNSPVTIFCVQFVQVSKPLDVKTKFMNIEDDILLEVQIQNITPHPMYLEVVSFDPAPGFKATNYNTVQQNPEGNQEDDQDGR